MPDSIEPYKFEQLVETIAPNGVLLRTWPLKGGISAEMIALEIKHPDGHTSRMILRQPGEQTFKRNPSAAEDEFKVLQLTQSLGLPAPRPYYLDLSGTILPTPYLVTEYIEGNPEFVAATGTDLSWQLAKQLAQIHSADLSNRDMSFLPKGPSECAETTRNQITGAVPSLDTRHIHNRLEEASPLPQRNASVLLHGDYWPGNILWREDTLAAVIDWEDAKVGDPLTDFAISRLDILWISGEDAMHSFTHHYQSLMDIDYTNLPYWDLCAALRLARLSGANLAEWTRFFIPFGKHDITEHTLREHFRFFVAQAEEKLRQ